MASANIDKGKKPLEEDHQVKEHGAPHVWFW
jgi:hypothetical protein